MGVGALRSPATVVVSVAVGAADGRRRYLIGFGFEQQRHHEDMVDDGVERARDQSAKDCRQEDA